jgi:hypothetical protein
LTSIYTDLDLVLCIGNQAANMQAFNYILIICMCLFLANLSNATGKAEVLNKERSAWKRETVKNSIYSTQTLGKISIGRDLFF